jgi:hypothetical protein
MPVGIGILTVELPRSQSDTPLQQRICLHDVRQQEKLSEQKYKCVLKPVVNPNNTEIKFLPHREHIRFTLITPTS